LARISVVDYDFKVLLDEFIMPPRMVLDYNTKYSGITAELLAGVTTTLEDI